MVTPLISNPPKAHTLLWMLDVEWSGATCLREAKPAGQIRRALTTEQTEAPLAASRTPGVMLDVDGGAHVGAFRIPDVDCVNLITDDLTSPAAPSTNPPLSKIPPSSGTVLASSLVPFLLTSSDTQPLMFRFVDASARFTSRKANDYYAPPPPVAYRSITLHPDLLA